MIKSLLISIAFLTLYYLHIFLSVTLIFKQVVITFFIFKKLIQTADFFLMNLFRL
jgi:hypothetical protein